MQYKEKGEKDRNLYCSQFLPHKKRMCNLARAPNSLYCGNHQPLTCSDSHMLPNQESVGVIAHVGNRVRKEAERKGMNVERVCCPVDGTHTVYKHCLEAHVKVCVATRIQSALEQQPFYSCESNSGGDLSYPTAEKREHDGNDRDPNELASLIRKVYNEHVGNELRALDSRVRSLSIEESALLSKAKERVLSGLHPADTTSFDRKRHAVQAAEISERLVDKGLLSVDVSSTGMSRRSFVELGAGRGYLGLAVKLVEPTAGLVLVERAGVRHKADRLLKEHNMTYERVRMDIRYLNLSKVPLPDHSSAVSLSSSSPSSSSTASESTVVIAKHLCGLATDLGIRSFVGLARDHRVERQQTLGLCIATCCHHACSWADYTGRRWWESVGLTAADFDMVRVWSGWATMRLAREKSGRGVLTRAHDDDVALADNDADDDDNDDAGDDADADDNDNEHAMTAEEKSAVGRPEGLSRVHMCELGRMSKRIIDQGRVHYLRSQLHDLSIIEAEVEQQQYCDAAYSPECVLITVRGQRCSNVPT